MSTHGGNEHIPSIQKARLYPVTHTLISHSPQYWSNEDTVIEYISISIPYIECLRDNFGDTQCALVIMDNFKVQICSKVLEKWYVC